MMNYRKYQRQYFLPPYPCMKWAEKDYVDKAPYGAAWICVTATRRWWFP